MRIIKSISSSYYAWIVQEDGEDVAGTVTLRRACMLAVRLISGETLPEETRWSLTEED